MPTLDLNHDVNPDSSTGPSGSKLEIHAFVNDAASEAVIREALDEFCSGSFTIAAMDCTHAIARLRRGHTPKILIIDVSKEEQPITVLVELASVLEPSVQVLVIGDRQDANFYRQITRGLGAMEYLYKPLTRAMVARFFGPYLTDGHYEPEVTRGGRVLGFVGARGGVGTTTLCANLGWYLGQVARRHTLVVDPNLYDGAVSILLGIKSDNGLRTAFESPQRVDDLFIERSAQRVGERCDVLTSQVDLGEEALVAHGAVKHLVDLVRKRYNFVIVDLASGLDAINREFSTMCHQRVIVMDSTLPALRDTLRHMSSSENNTHAARPLVVLNKHGQPGGLSLTEITKGLGRQPDVIIPYLPKFMNEAEIAARPAALEAGQFNASIASLAHEAASVSASKLSSAEGGLRGRVSRLKARVKP